MTRRAAIMPNRPARHSPSRRGLTLIELLIVVALIGMATTYAAVRLSGATDNATLRGARIRLEQTLRRARLEAARYRRPIWIEFQLGSDRYKLTRATDRADATSETWQSLGGVIAYGENESESSSTDIAPQHLAIRVLPSGVTLPWRLHLRAGHQACTLWSDGVTDQLHHEDLNHASQITNGVVGGGKP